MQVWDVELKRHEGTVKAMGDMVMLNDEQNMITSIASKEGQEVNFVSGVSTVDYLR